jgi:hypothetical protein
MSGKKPKRRYLKRKTTKAPTVKDMIEYLYEVEKSKHIFDYTIYPEIRYNFDCQKKDLD